MKVFLTGGTGVLGRRLVPLLASQGHEIVALSRRHDKDEVLAKLGAHPARVGLFDSEGLAKAARGCDVIVHAATSIPTAARVRPTDWQANDRVRIEGTRNLAHAAKAVGARRLVLMSISWLGGGAPGAVFDESTPTATTRRSWSGLEAERIATTAAEAGGLEASILRCGWFYAADSPQTRMMGEGLVKRRMPVIGRGDNRVSLLHADDAASAFATAVSHDAAGLWHVVDDAPVATGTFFDAFAAHLDARPPRRVPRWLARIVAGSDAVDFLTREAATTNAAFRKATGWAPRFATHEQGIADIVDTWAHDGTLAGWSNAGPTSRP